MIANKLAICKGERSEASRTLATCKVGNMISVEFQKLLEPEFRFLW